MKTRLALLTALGSLLATTPVLAQGATGAISRPGWSRGAAPTSDFNAQGAPMSRNEMVRQRAAAGRPPSATVPPRRPRR